MSQFATVIGYCVAGYWAFCLAVAVTWLVANLLFPEKVDD